MSKVIITIGASGAGKTTWSLEYMKKHPNTIRVNRDDLRKCMFGTLDDYYQHPDLNKREVRINDIEDLIYMNALNAGWDVLVDNTHLRPKYIERWIGYGKVYKDNSIGIHIDVETKFKIFPEADSNILKKRINVRDAPLGWDKLNYIDKHVSSLRSAIAYVEDNYKDMILNE